MKAMIFAAGLGTRLAPLTDNIPKALIEVGGQPMIRRVIGHLRKAGITEIVVNVHHHASMLKAYLTDNDFGVSILISDESDRLLDTGGAVVKAADLLRRSGNAPVILYNADIFTDFPISEMMDQHISSRADVTLLADTRESSRRLLFDVDNRMCGWRNTQTGETRSPYSKEITDNCRGLAFGGVHIINTDVINHIERYGDAESDGKFSITPFYTDWCDRLDIHSFTPIHPYNWIDIGRPETLARARELAARL